jgi:pimeloyl-ACP methyl ester carboxylesterase
MSQIKLSDGRNFEYEDNGVKSDQAILFLHGTPSADKLWSKWLPQVTECLAIAASRAGYGKSDRHKGRTVADDLADQQALLDHFHIKEFVSIGWSGGGPHSINMTRDPRSKGAITLAGNLFGNAATFSSNLNVLGTSDSKISLFSDFSGGNAGIAIFNTSGM